jgi:hypothetical protein
MPAAPDSATIMAALSTQFVAYGYHDFMAPANEFYVNDVSAGFAPTTSLVANSQHVFPPAWKNGSRDNSGGSGTARPWPIPTFPGGPTGEGGLDGTTDGDMAIVEHTSPACSIWESSGTKFEGTQPLIGPASLSAYSAGEYQTIAAPNEEQFYGDFGGWPGCPPASGHSTSAATCEGGTGPTRLSNLIPSIKWEEVDDPPSTLVQHTLELVMPPCGPAGQAPSVYPANESEGVIGSCHDDANSMRYGETWIMSATAPCMAAINAHPASQDYAVAYGLIHHGAMLLNTTGRTTNLVLYAFNGIGAKYPATSAYGGFSYLHECHFLTDGYILPHRPSL